MEQREKQRGRLLSEIGEARGKCAGSARFVSQQHTVTARGIKEGVGMRLKKNDAIKTGVGSSPACEVDETMKERATKGHPSQGCDRSTCVSHKLWVGNEANTGKRHPWGWQLEKMKKDNATDTSTLNGHADTENLPRLTNRIKKEGSEYAPTSMSNCVLYYFVCMYLLWYMLFDTTPL